MRSICGQLVIGMMPGTSGTPMPARRALETERTDTGHQLDRRLARLRPGARHGDEPRAEGAQRVDRTHEGFLARGGGGREELEGDDGASLGVALADLHAARRATSCP